MTHLCHYSPRNHHPGCIKTFPQLPGTEPGPKTWCSQFSNAIAATQHTQQKTERILLYFHPHFTDPLSASQLLGPLLPFSSMYSSTPIPILGVYPNEILLHSVSLLSSLLLPSCTIIIIIDNSKFLDHFTMFQVLYQVLPIYKVMEYSQ